MERSGAPRLDVTFWPREIDGILAETVDPHRRAMLKNMRRHQLLELSGRWQEVLAPEYTVEVPRYRVVTPLGADEYVGLEAVTQLYQKIFGSGGGIWSPIEEELAVTDHSVIAESHLGAFMRGEFLPSQMGTDLIEDQWYLLAFRQVYIFEFDKEALLIGERSYDSGSSQIYEVSPEEVITCEAAAILLKPYLDNPPE